MCYQMITDDSALAACCEQAAAQQALALDSEFVRTRSYYPHLGLLQMAFPGVVALIDPLTINDWTPFTRLLQLPSVIKFIHSASEDLEVLQHRFQLSPEPFIDTQVLAAFSGHSLSTGLAALLAQHAGISLDKSETRTDWLARPLTDRQCAYASADVAYLLPVAEKLMHQVQASGWLEAVYDECRLIARRRTTPPQPQQVWRDFDNHWLLRPRQLAALQLLAAWRLHEAQRHDIAINFVIRPEKLWMLARYLPGSAGELSALGLTGREIRLYAQPLLAHIHQAQALADDALPAVSQNPGQLPGFRAAGQAIKQHIGEIAAQCGLSSELLASRRQIQQLLHWHWHTGYVQHPPELLSGWRSRLLATPLTTLLEDYAVPA